MRGLPWLKLWNETFVDDRFDAAADMAGSTVAVATFAFLRASAAANQNDDRGSFAGLSLQVIASRCKVPLDEIRRLFDAFLELGMIAGDRIADWDKRQCCTEKPIQPAATHKAPKPPLSAAARKRRQRAKVAAARSDAAAVSASGGVRHECHDECHETRHEQNVTQADYLFENQALSRHALDSEKEGESENNGVSIINLESVTAREGARMHEGVFESDPDVPSGAARPLATAVASEDQPPQPREPDAYVACIRAAKRDNMPATLRGAIRHLRWGEAERDFIEALQKITGDQEAWDNRAKADKEKLTQLRKAAAEYSAQHGPIQALARTHWVPTEDPHDAREALRDIYHILERQRQEEWDRRHSMATRPVAADPVLEPSCAA
jgi:hypothetical protein